MKGRMLYVLLVLLLAVSIVGPAVAQEPAGDPCGSVWRLR